MAFLSLLTASAAGAAQQTAAGEFVVGGAEPCKLCHPSQVASLSATNKGLRMLSNPRNAKEASACEACHGPAAAHVASAGTARGAGFISFTKRDPASTDQRNGVCLQCHTGGAVALWHGSTHDSPKLACVDCHAIHGGHEKFLAMPTEQQLCTRCHQQVKAALLKPSHHPLREEKMTCTACHNPHGSPAGKLIAANTVNDKCYECHADKRGPFLFEHPPVRENCLNCHEPHGSSHQAMLRVRQPLLCQRCHSNQLHPSTLYALSAGDASTGRSVYTANPQLLYRSCSNCHVQVHGTNHPSGKFWHR